MQKEAKVVSPNFGQNLLKVMGPPPPQMRIFAQFYFSLGIYAYAIFLGSTRFKDVSDGVLRCHR